MSSSVKQHVSIRAFGIAADLIGQKHLQMPIPQGCKVQHLKAMIVQAYPDFKDINGFQLAIGDEYATDNNLIPDNAVISIIPPVSGG